MYEMIDQFQFPDFEIDNPGNWLSMQFDEGQWQTTLDPEAIKELLALTFKLKKRGFRAPNFGIDDFQAPRARKCVSQLLEELENGKGFVVIREPEFAKLAVDEMEILFWGIGLMFGAAVPINADGDLLGRVRDLGFDINNPWVRNYQTTEELILHNDSCDVLGLFCVQQAKSGGDSAIGSAIAIHNHIFKTRPDLLQALYTPLPIDRRGEQGWPGEANSKWYALPVFSLYQGRISARYTVLEYYYQSQKFDDAPRITPIQREALEYLRTTASDPRFHFNFRLQSGDIQLLNNYCVFHARTNFTDYPETYRKRHLLRLWLSVTNSRPLHPVFASRFRSAKAGTIRGGISPRRTRESA